VSISFARYVDEEATETRVRARKRENHSRSSVVTAGALDSDSDDAGVSFRCCRSRYRFTASAAGSYVDPGSS